MIVLRIFAYFRVSTADQSLDTQVHEIEVAGFNIDPRRIVAKTVSGSVAAMERQGFRKLMERLDWDDVLIVTKLDRLGRNAMDVPATVERLAELQVRVHCLTVGGVNNGGLRFQQPINDGVSEDITGIGDASAIGSSDTLVADLRGCRRPVFSDLGRQLPGNVDILDYYSQPTGMNNSSDSSALSSIASKSDGSAQSTRPVIESLPKDREHELTNLKPAEIAGTLAPVMDALPKD